MWQALVMSLALMVGSAQAAPQPMVLSIDDGPSLATTPRLSPEQRHAALRETLARHGITAVMYVTLNFGADRPAGLALARAWGEAGHLLGNHTVSHPDIDDQALPLQRYLDEIGACDAALHHLPGWRRWFRATYLHEGQAPERRAGLRRYLAEQGYRIAPVQLDSRDWQYSPRLQAQLLDPAADGSALKAEYLAQLGERARALQSAGSAPVVLLVHDNLLTALVLDDALRLLQAAGFVFVHPERAMAEPAQN